MHAFRQLKTIDDKLNCTRLLMDVTLYMYIKLDTEITSYVEFTKEPLNFVLHVHFDSVLSHAL